MSEFHQHVPKKKQLNKPHNRIKDKGRVERKPINVVQAQGKELHKHDVYNRNVQLRKHKKAMMIAERRGLNKTNVEELKIDDDVKELIKPHMQNIPPKIVAIIGLNEWTNVEEIKNKLIKECSENDEGEDMNTDENNQMKAYIVESGANLGIKRQRLIFQSVKRDPYSVLDVAKVADIIIFTFSCEEAKVDKVKDDPDEFANAIDETGYKILSLLRVQGIPPSIGVLQHIEKINPKKRNMIKKLFHRYFVSEFNDEYKFHVIDGTSEGLLDSSYKNLVRMITGTFQRTKLFWKENRSYMLCSDYSECNGNLEISGYIRENFLSCNRIGHITGYGDFKIQQIVAVNDPCPIKKHGESKRKKKQDNEEMDNEETIQVIQTWNEATADIFQVENEVDPFGAEQTWPTKDELKNKGKNTHEEYKDVNMNEEPGEMKDELHNQFKKEPIKNDGVNELANKFEKMEIQVIGGKDVKSEPDFEDDEDVDDFSFDELQSQLNKTSLKHEKLTNVAERERDEMDFPDEVDTPTDQPAKERFSEYRSIANIKTWDWDPYETLPQEYAKIWRFENFAQIKKLAIQTTEEQGLPIDGTFIKIILIPLDEKSKNSVELLKLSKEKQRILFSTLMPHETKVTLSHFRIRRFEEEKSIVKSKSTLEFHIGFRRFLSRPIFSDEYLNTNKAKFYRFLPHEDKVLASAYTPVCFPNSQVIVLKRGDWTGDQIDIDFETQEPTLLAFGTVTDPDPLKIILKRIVLTGYPIKCKRKRAVIRYMFFNKEDIRYFKPVELYTKFGLRGKIKDSLGTHGLMKCYFTDGVNPSDTVWMPLYKRIYPPFFPQTWTSLI